MLDNVKLVSCDIDGTLAPTGSIVNDNTVQCIEELRANGILFGLATGRKVYACEKFYKKWGLSRQFDFIIGLNGVEVGDYVNNKRYEYLPLSCVQLKNIVEIMSEYDCTIAQYGQGDENTYYTNDLDDFTRHLLRYSEMDVVMVDDLSFFYQKENGGIMFRFKNDVCDELYNEIIEKCKDKDFKPFKTQSFLIEFSNRNINKGYALEKLMEIYHLNNQQCVSFGDTSNDNEMLEKTIGVCLLNGTEDTKAAARFITEKPVEEDGFADFIRKNIEL